MFSEDSTKVTVLIADLDTYRDELTDFSNLGLLQIREGIDDFTISAVSPIIRSYVYRSLYKVFHKSVTLFLI